MVKPQEFFQEKKPWSKYKDLILDYYLGPYLSKVATLKKPIVVVDCFAGPGIFDDGELGSPLIISNKLKPLYDKGVKVSAFYIESDPSLYTDLQNNTKNCGIPIQTRSGKFQDYIDEISTLASTHTIFVYVDPIRPSELLFNDLKSVYDRLHVGQSVETLINFMSTNFWRGVLGSKDKVMADNVLLTDNKNVLHWNAIAGGTYWQKIAFNQSLPSTECVDEIANGYSNQLNEWFKYVLKYPVREKYTDLLPKYHLIFGSRYSDAVELMNRAMVKARREFIGARFVKGMLFENQPAEEMVDPEEIKKILLETLRSKGRLSWKMLRVYATLVYPCMYTESELNRSIKQLLQGKLFKSSCSGEKVQDEALIQLDSAGI